MSTLSLNTHPAMPVRIYPDYCFLGWWSVTVVLNTGPSYLQTLTPRFLHTWEEKKDLMYHKNMEKTNTLLLHILDAVTHVKDNPN